MTALILGLILFVAVHSVRVVADAWRSTQIARLGLTSWRVGHSVLSTAGFALMVWGYGQARMTSPDLWSGPDWMRHVAVALMFPAVVLWVAVVVPGTRIKAWVGHPAAAGVAIWAAAHLLTNARPADLVLFGSLLIWAVLSYVAGWRRDRVRGRILVPRSTFRDLLVVVSAAVIWAAFAHALHVAWIGVAPLP